MLMQDEAEKEIPATQAALERKMQGVQQRLEGLRRLQPLAARAQKLRLQDVPELTAQVEKLGAEAGQQADAAMAAQEEHKTAQETLQV